MKHRSSCAVVIALVASGMPASCAPGGEDLAARSLSTPVWEADNPIRPLPTSSLGIDFNLSDLREPPTPERVRLGRWLFSEASQLDPRAITEGDDLWHESTTC
jgi:hypothetical protein